MGVLERNNQPTKTKKSWSELLFHRTAAPSPSPPPSPEEYLQAYKTVRKRYARAYNVSVWAMAKRHENERLVLLRDLDRRRTQRAAELASHRDRCPWRWDKPGDQLERACLHHACLSKRVAPLPLLALLAGRPKTGRCTYCLWHHLVRAQSREAWALHEEHEGKARAAYAECRGRVGGLAVVRWVPPVMRTEPVRGSGLWVTDWAENARGLAGLTRDGCVDQVREWEGRVGRCCRGLFTLREMFVNGEGWC